MAVEELVGHIVSPRHLELVVDGAAGPEKLLIALCIAIHACSFTDAHGLCCDGFHPKVVG